MELNREQIIKALECCLLSNEHQEEECEKCPFYETYEMICQNLLAYHALSLIKELTEEIDQRIEDYSESQKKWEKAYDELEAENERLRAAVRTDMVICRARGSGKSEFLRNTIRIRKDAIVADTVREMQDRFNEKVAKLLISPSLQYQASAFIDQIAREMVKEG